ncbi:GntR family transcriptional regulator [Cognatishimia activa]|uniref:GntR family transcriptional regulator n=1 Tax=Cognatishimia activa TaxID=1715691 RepID=A0A975ES46_9RHOB|nr:GntR family transcriptional regulator [Cognatishimia activa]QTN37230.1 GntR family transcriptional regulator [Cognatishimia activa]
MPQTLVTADENTTSDQKVVTILRQRIMDGSLKADTKISEVLVSEMLDVSRTPARMALQALESEGLIRKRDGRGYTVLSFNSHELAQAYEVRGVLEGLAAGTLAREGIDVALATDLGQIIEDIDTVLASDQDPAQRVTGFQSLNRDFHQAIMTAADNRFIGHAYQRLAHLPLVSLGSVVFNADKADEEITRLKFANMQHRLILDAILRRDAMRAESLMREHANQIPIYTDLLV